MTGYSLNVKLLTAAQLLGHKTNLDLKIMIVTKVAYLIDYEKHEIQLNIFLAHANLPRLPRKCIWVS